jgi:metal-responsive CopG/Arc/MetJ family transcriptional regulator
MQNATQNVNLRLPGYLLAYLEQYQKQHGLSSRTEVIIKAIQTLREQELIEGYKALSREYRSRPDPLAQQPSRDGLVPSSEEDW